MSIHEVPATTPEIDEHSFAGKMQKGNDELMSQGDPERALDFFMEALSYADSGNLDQINEANLGLARALCSAGRLDEAEVVALELERFFRDGDEEQHDKVVRLIRNITEDRINLGRRGAITNRYQI